MILEPAQIAALHAGELVDHTINVTKSHRRLLDNGEEIVVRPFTHTKTYAAQIKKPGEPPKTSCRMHVVSCVHDVPGKCWKLHLRIARVQQEPPRLLKAGLVVKTNLPEEHARARGYTDRPSEALSREPEAIPAEVQEKYSKERREAHEEFLATLDERPAMEQLAFALRLAEEEGVDPAHVHSQMRRRAKSLLRQIEQRRIAKQRDAA
jgi:hypothetical protein